MYESALWRENPFLTTTTTTTTTATQLGRGKPAGGAYGDTGITEMD